MSRLPMQSHDIKLLISKAISSKPRAHWGFVSAIGKFSAATWARFHTWKLAFILLGIYAIQVLEEVETRGTLHVGNPNREVRHAVRGPPRKPAHKARFPRDRSSPRKPPTLSRQRNRPEIETRKAAFEGRDAKARAGSISGRLNVAGSTK